MPLMHRYLFLISALSLSGCESAVQNYAHLFGLGVHPEVTTSKLLNSYGAEFDKVASLVDLTASDDKAAVLEQLNQYFENDPAVLEISFYGPCCGGGSVRNIAYSFQATDFGMGQKSCSGAFLPGQNELWRCDWRSYGGQEWDVLKYTRYMKIDDVTWVLAAEFEYSELIARIGS